MIELTLTTQEREILSEVLHRTIGELAREIASTDSRSFRDDLKFRRELLERLHGALSNVAVAV